MRIDQLALLFALVVAANLVLLIALQLPRLGRRFSRGPSAVDAYTRPTGGATPEPGSSESGGSARPMLAGSSGLPAGLYQRMTRVVSFMFIGSAMAIVALTGAPDATAIIVLLAFGLILIELFQDVLPSSALGTWRLPLEAAIVLIFLTVLIAMTGGHESPYFFGYILLVGAAALSTSDFGAAVLAITSSIAYIGAVVLASGAAALLPADFGLVAFNLVSISLVMYVASVIGREQRRAREEALRLSRFDSLTALYSRDYLMSEVEQEILRATRTGRPFAIAMIDLDGLKAANDRFGHDWGDNLLKAVADVLKGDIRVTDVASRYGGDEFALMLPETDLSGAVLVAEKVRVDISRIALPHNGAVVRTSASIGIVTFPDDGRTSAELMRRADLAMYEAKRRGRDQIVRFARDANAPPAAVGPRVHTGQQAPTGQLAYTDQSPPTAPASPIDRRWASQQEARVDQRPMQQAATVEQPAPAREPPTALQPVVMEMPAAERPALVSMMDPTQRSQPPPTVATLPDAQNYAPPPPQPAPAEQSASAVPAYSTPGAAVPAQSPGRAPWEL